MTQALSTAGCIMLAGVILYILLAASPPFQESALEAAVEKVRYHFRSPVWNTVSENAKV